MGCRSIHPQNVGQLFRLVTLGTIQSPLQSIKNCLVNGLSFPIALRICQGRVPIRDAEIMAKIAEGPAVELQSIVGDKGVRHPKSSDYILPHKFLDVHVPNVGQRFGLCPLGEVINRY